MLIDIDSIKTLLNGTVEKIKNTIRPNWDVNDTSDPCYIKGRTHWVEQVNQYLINDSSVPFAPMSDGSTYYISQNPFSLDINAGEKLTVVWDNTNYESNVVLQATDIVYVGNPMIYMLSLGYTEEEAISSGVINTGEPFYILKFPSEINILTDQPGDSHRIAIGATIETIHKLDSKYLPTDSSVPYLMDGDVYTKDEVYTKDKLYTRTETLTNFYTRTYLDNNFLRGTDAESIYLTKYDATNTYLTKENGVSYFNDNDVTVVTGEFPCPPNSVSGRDGIYYVGYGVSDGEFALLFNSRDLLVVSGYGNTYVLTKKEWNDSVFNGQYYGNMYLYNADYEDTGEPLLFIVGQETRTGDIIDVRKIYSNIASDGNNLAYVCGVHNVLPKSLIPDYDKKINLPETDGTVNYGTVGQFAVSDGTGGITWQTINNGDEVTY